MYGNSCIGLELWQVEVDRTDSMEISVVKHSGESVVVTGWTVFSHFLANDLQPLFPSLIFFPVFLQSDEDCDVVFTWKTPLACRPVVKDCTLAEDGATYDLQPLSRETGSWTLTDANGNK